MQPHFPAVILGGGVAGLAAGIASGAPVFEREASPGGICSSYYMQPGSRVRETCEQAQGTAYRFEHGGGHWIFGGHPDMIALVEKLASCDRHVRRSSVYFPDDRRFVGFPLQHHLHALEPHVAQAALNELLASRATDDPTMERWLAARFGPTLNELFFAPFHEAYTAGLWRTVAAQDGYKTPLDIAQVVRGASGLPEPAGYNTTFLYPREGLDALISRLATRADIRGSHAVNSIDISARTLVLGDGRTIGYRTLLSTLPLNRMIELCGLRTQAAVDPHTSVLVLNIGARRGDRCPDDHWLYISRSRSGFHRVGFYSNVAEHFLPVERRGRRDAVCIYVERSFVGGSHLASEEVTRYSTAAIDELKSWGFIEDVDVIDPTWVDVAYTWRIPGSSWVQEATRLLAAHDIRMVGRYARWQFQGIADSLRDGFLAGQTLRLHR